MATKAQEWIATQRPGYIVIQGPGLHTIEDLAKALEKAYEQGITDLLTDFAFKYPYIAHKPEFTGLVAFAIEEFNILGPINIPGIEDSTDD
jgi:hypothetical protein